MSPIPTTFLGLDILSTPTLSAEPGSEIPWGKPVTFVCRGHPEAKVFRLEKNAQITPLPDVKNPFRNMTEARFLINSVTEDTAGRYNCIYLLGYGFSNRSNSLELIVTGVRHSEDLLQDQLYFLIGVSVAFLLGFLLLVLFFLYRRHQGKHGIPSSKSKDQKPQERFGPGVDILKSTPDTATVDGLSENDREVDTSTPVAGGPQEVTYAQLDHQTLTQGAFQVVFPQTTEPPADSTTYATLIRH
ncbi:PREDICTED: leukocyte-associated immunoglobulin-like receptor 1-like [Chrysochloris asiatica]|uniref:Leukocyte-associated immunoglobulin-like receptor 1-like n=1 Tax=Chrysochloris asiatica TaxID=185453 RepID=A0A9B0TQC7_CHRAS|nr:PREDICTED: leukocyte-associated immunoglobulin-like receptor 1-like [Chrysochloris asiatica]